MRRVARKKPKERRLSEKGIDTRTSELRLIHSRSIGREIVSDDCEALFASERVRDIYLARLLLIICTISCGCYYSNKFLRDFSSPLITEIHRKVDWKSSMSLQFLSRSRALLKFPGNSFSFAALLFFPQRSREATIQSAIILHFHSWSLGHTSVSRWTQRDSSAACDATETMYQRHQTMTRQNSPLKPADRVQKHG